MNADNINEKYSKREELKQQIKEKQGWYFITFVRELPRERPYGFTLFKEPFVLFKDKSDKWTCYLLPSPGEENSDVTIFPFKVVEKQGEVWFWRGKI